MLLPLALQLVLAAPTLSTESIPNDFPVVLGLSLELTHPAELAALKAGQQDPASPDFRRWLTPQEFGARFGQSPATYAQLIAWLNSGGLDVTVYPSRAFLVATGKAAQVEALLQVQLQPVEGEAVAVHTMGNRPTLPERFRQVILNISGLDTRVRFKHHIQMPGNQPASFGPQDLRRFYGLQPLLDQGYTGQGQKTVVLSTALAASRDVSTTAVNYFFQNISDATAVYQRRQLPNPGNDFDNQAGGNLEFELDLMMQSVGAPGADSITLEIPPASQVFTIGANDIVNNLSTATAVSVSLGLCEQGEQQNDQQSGQNEIGALHNALIQGTMEGQTWSAATGDNGANDCRTGNLISADFPSVIPEFVGAGGSSVPQPAWDVNHALAGYQQEVTWNDGAQGGAGGGGRSILFPIPSYQVALNLPGTGGRSVPDISLISGLPAVAVASAQPPGQLGPVEGTSVASPLSAGFFALIASKVGCRLGDVHAALYTLGAAQFDGGGPAVFHDITSGNLTVGNVVGPSAGYGYDSATGWGSMNVAALAAAWPACPSLPDGGSLATDAGLVAIYTQCGALNCDGGCTTIPEGPSTCSPTCNVNVAGGCPTGSICSSDTVFSSGANGSCVPGCSKQADCVSQPGTVCSTCAQVCVPAGNPTSAVGSACVADSNCPSGSYCSLSRTFGTTGYCTYDCVSNVPPTDACACPSGSTCGRIGRGFPVNLCLATCPNVGQDCGGRAGYICQPQTNLTKVCLPKCTITVRNGQTIDSCLSIGTTKTCDVPSGICGGPVPIVDAGTPADAGTAADAGTPPADAGMMVADAGPQEVTIPGVDPSLGAANPMNGCGCGATTPAPLLLGALALLLARRRRDA
jgi:kumamolisin